MMGHQVSQLAKRADLMTTTGTTGRRLLEELLSELVLEQYLSVLCD
jgi:hypothetical protein